MKLYFNPISLFSQKVIMAFCEKGITYEPVKIELADPTKNKEYRAIYPLGKVPSMEAAGTVIGESTSIIEWLDEAYPDVCLIPKAFAREVRHFDRLADLYISSNISLLFFQGLKPEAARDSNKMKTAFLQIHTTLAQCEAVLEAKQAKTNPEFLFGDGLTMADLSLIPALTSVSDLVDLSDYPQVNAYLKLNAQRPSLVTAREGLQEAVQQIAKAFTQ